MRVPTAVVSFSRGWQILLAALLLICASLAWAQTDDSQGDAGDPPARVARLSYAAGDLGLMPSGSTDWSAADVNRPLTNGDKLSSGADARAELDLGGASLRINSQSDIGVLNLNDQIGQFELTQGTLNLTVRNIDQGATYEIDTPTLALVVNQPGTFRIDVGANGNGTTVTVLDGGGIVYGENNAQRDVFSGRTYAFADSTLNNITVTDIEGRDEFDAWCSDRDAQYANTSNEQYVSSDVVGSQDLDQYGDWQQDDDYGAVWYPTTVVAGWAPYRYGHWAWIGPWGWTWVDSMPWGFAPYHYGRWAFIRNRWGWIPCPPRVRPVYAPALVAFVGMGAGGPVGWFPLGPHEVYNPWYRASRGYYTNVNMTNIAIGRRYNRATL
ncbi:MAG TPA: FecR family protein, partial [Dyella sp.]|nr:FecR family protein [Dyella sp.]